MILTTISEYDATESIVFHKTKELYGELSNFSSKYLISLKEEKYVSEMIYQALKFPNSPSIQALILSCNNPGNAKRIAEYHKNHIIDKWHQGIKIKIMNLVIIMKIIDNPKLSNFLINLPNKNIVEKSFKDSYWGAIPSNKNCLKGINVLGKLWDYNRTKILNNENLLELKINEIEGLDNIKFMNVNFISLIKMLKNFSLPESQHNEGLVEPRG